MAVIETSGLTKTFGGSVVAVDDLALEVGEGEVYGFLGPNGAGKSTTINLLLGFVDPTAGEVRVLGHDPHEEPTAIRERVGLLPEGSAPYEHLTGREHVEFAMECKGVDGDPDAVLDRVGLSRTDARRPAGDYSKGMTQRLGLGMALVGDPELLILDEPSSGLDPTGMQEIRDLVRAEAEAGTAVFFSSHILAEVEAVCDRVGILDGGQLVAEDSFEALRAGPVGESVIELHVESVPGSGFGLEDLPGVVDVTTEQGLVSATCETPATKIDVVEAVNERATISDIVSEGTSLERVFETHTAAESGAPPTSAPDGSDAAVSEVVE